MKRILGVMVVLVMLGTGSVRAEDVYDDAVGDGSVTTTCTSPEKVTVNARAVTVENLSSSTDAVFFRFDADPVKTGRRGLEPGEKVTVDVTHRHTSISQVRICADGTGAATYVVRWVK